MSSSVVTPVWTDYPISRLGDTPGQLAPVRKCQAVSYDGDKYVTVLVEGLQEEFKRCYLYSRPGRVGKVRAVAERRLLRLPRTNLTQDAAP